MATTANTGSTDEPPDRTGDPHRPPRGRWIAAAAAVAVIVVAGAAGVLNGGADKPTTKIAAAAPTAVTLALPGGDGAVSSGTCVPFDVKFLRDMPVAFAGTATSVTGEKVTLSVDRWYQGSVTQQEADVATLSIPGGGASKALLGIDFTQGEKYLVAATGGNVNGCGFSGPATAELEAAYTEAFGG